jgi:PAS domain S-box-containing protein
MPCYLSVQDRELRVIDGNNRLREDFGDFEGRYCYQLYKHRSEQCEDCPVARTFHDGEGHRSEQTLRSQDGREIQVIVYTTPIRNEEGQVTSVIEMLTDITDLKLLEGRLRRSQERYELLFDEVPCYVTVQDRDLRVLRANHRFRDDFSDELGRKCYEIYKHRAEPCVPCPVQDALRDGQVHESEEIVTSRDGESINVLVSASPVRNAEGEIDTVLETSTNITEIRQLQSQLTSIGMLVGSISHGIKGLLSGLDGGRYLLNTGLAKSDEDRVERGWDMVQRNMARIKSMVLNILYYAKDREPEWETLSAQEVFEELHEMVQSKAQRRNVELTTDSDEGVGEFEADPEGVRALLINLLDNSLDACRQDGKKDSHRVDMRLRGHVESVEFEIEDNGVGMDRETREKAFTLFFSSKGGEGTGLGLFIANKICQAHGGRIEIESEVDRGTRFAIVFPRKRPQPDESGDSPQSEMEEHTA